MSNQMTYGMIEQKICSNEYNTNLKLPRQTPYPEGHVFDEQKSVIWNRKERIRRNEIQAELTEAYHLDLQRLDNEFRADLIDMMVSQTGKLEQATVIYDRVIAAWPDGGYLEILQAVDELLTLVLMTE